MEALRRVSIALIVLGFLLIVVWVARVAFAAQSLRAHLAQMEGMARQSDLAPLCETMWSTRDDVTALRREVGGLVALAPSFGWLPIFGNDARAAPALLDAADALTEAGARVCEAFARSGVRDVSLSEGVRVLAENPALLQQAHTQFTRAEQALVNVDAAALSWLLSARVAQIQRVVPLGRAGLAAASFAPTLAGFDRPRNYLVLALNEDELRPGGGFITGVGEVRVDKGHIVAITFRDSYAADDFSAPYPDPPEPLRWYLGIEQWVFRDANWSPDMPTWARQAMTLYRAKNFTPDGLIALDQRGAQELVAGLGSLRVPDNAEPITGANVAAYMRRAWAPSDGSFTGAWWLKRKSFMGPLADAARARIEAGDYDKLLLAQAVWRIIEGKHLQIFVEQPEAQAALREQGWDGSLRASGGDYLMVVDANLGYNKVNARMKQSLNYQIDLSAQPPRAQVALTYTNTAPANYPCRPETRYDPVYDQMTNRCYWDYVRVYVPADARLDDATRVPIPASATWDRHADAGTVIARRADEGDWLSLEALMVLPTATTQTRHFALTQSDDVVQWVDAEGRYALRIQKQPGAPDFPVTVQVRLPNAGVFIQAQPSPVAVEGDRVTFKFALNRDVDILLRWKRQ
ncbi:MAG: DUF4012 domain-containing protein [Chloroflexi bacterium]|nr:DUF4012 domain-containing protein [Chloroflexota bacterium]